MPLALLLGMINPETLLVCGAFEGEIDLLSKIPSLNIFKTGIGGYESVFNLQYYITRYRKIKSILFAGSAGAYPHSSLNIGDFVASNAFVYREIGELKGMVKVPSKMGRNLITEQDPELQYIYKNFKKATTNSPNYITLMDLEYADCVDYLFDVDAENMEAFGLAYTAYRFSIPFTACYVITNKVGSVGSNQWASNWREGSNALQKMLLKIIFGKVS